jgi:hypothetical protein
MAKALYGHVGPVDARLRDEVQRLRLKTRDLEFEVARLQAENDRLDAAHRVAQVSAGVTDDELARLTEPAFS